MKEKIYEGFNEAYKNLINDLLNNYDYICSPRGMKIKEILGYKFTLKNPRDRILNFKTRNMSLPYAIGEFAWYMRGENSLNTMEYYSKNMKNFSDDGMTLNSAYGYRIFGRHKMIFHNQWERVIKQLKNDKDSRQGVIHIQTPDEFLKVTKDLTCTLNLQFFIRKNKLNMITHMRSNDIWWGTTYDVFNFTMMQELLSIQLGVKLGTYTHIANSLHLYEKNFKSAEKLLKEKVITSPMKSMSSLETKELSLFTDNEETIRRLGWISENLKSKIYSDFIKILYNYKRKKT